MLGHGLKQLRPERKFAWVEFSLHWRHQALCMKRRNSLSWLVNRFLDNTGTVHTKSHLKKRTPYMLISTSVYIINAPNWQGIFQNQLGDRRRFQHIASPVTNRPSKHIRGPHINVKPSQYTTKGTKNGAEHLSDTARRQANRRSEARPT
jgi:hypothetical protein